MCIVSTVVGTGCLLFIIWQHCHISVTNLSITALTVAICIWKETDIFLCQESNLCKVQCLPDILRTLLPLLLYIANHCIFMVNMTSVGVYS